MPTVHLFTPSPLSHATYPSIHISTLLLSSGLFSALMEAYHGHTPPRLAYAHLNLIPLAELCIKLPSISRGSTQLTGHSALQSKYLFNDQENQSAFVIWEMARERE